MYRTKRRFIFSVVLMLMLLLTGCGDNSQPIAKENDYVQTNTKSSESSESSKENPDLHGSGEAAGKEHSTYYSIKESALPDPDKQIKAFLNGEKYVAEDPVLHEDTVYRYIIVFDEDGNHKAYYLQTLKLSEKEWSCISASEDFEIEGKVYSGFDEPFVSENEKLYSYVYCPEEKRYYLGILDENGIEEIICPIPTEMNDEINKTYLNSKLTCDSSGKFYFFRQSERFDEAGEDLNFLDGLLQKQGKMKIPGKIQDILQGMSDSEVYWYGINEEEKVTIRKVTNGEILLDGFEGIDGYECEAEFSASGTLFMADKRTLWKVEEEPELVFDFIQKDYIVDALYGMEAGENGEMKLLVDLDGDYTLLRIQESDSPVETEKQEIVIALAREHLSLEKIIARFNRQSDKYHISVMMPQEDENEAEFRDRIQLEISVGKGPDIMGHDVILNIQPYVENDYLECLEGLLENESEYLTAALEGCRINGKLYGIPYDCVLRFVAYSKEHTAGKSAWTVSELMKAVRESDAQILQGGYSGVDIVKYYGLYDNSNTAYIDWENGESHLTKKPFLDLLAFAKEYADTGKLEGEAGELAASGEAFGAEVSMYNNISYNMNYLYECFKGEPALIGFPREEGNGIYVSSRELYVNSSSGCKEGAKEFLRYLLSEEVQTMYVDFDVYEEMSSGGYWGHIPQFPIHLKAYEVLADKAREEKDTTYYTPTGMMNGLVFEDPASTEEQLEQFYLLLENAQPDNYKAAVLSGIIEEELAPYFAGEVSAEHAAEILDNRVQLYLDERGN